MKNNTATIGQQYSVSLAMLFCCYFIFAAPAFAEEEPAIEEPVNSSVSSAPQTEDAATQQDSIDTASETKVAEEDNKKTDSVEQGITENQADLASESTENNPAKDKKEITQSSEGDPLMKACEGEKPGVEKTVNGITITCNAKQQQTEVFDFKEATPIEPPSNGFVGFSDRYLNNFYLATGFGYANYASMVSYADLDALEQQFIDQGYDDVQATGGQHGMNADISLGYIANKYILIELGYSYLGTVGVNATVSDGINSFDYATTGSMSSLNVSTIVRYKLNDLVLLPITNIIHIMTILEAHQWSRETTASYLASTLNHSSSGYGFSVGLGGDFQINKYLTARGLWQYKTIGNEGISAFMLSAVMKNNTRYAQAIQNSIINPITSLWK